MIIAIFWQEILHYHAARINALCHLAEKLNHKVIALALTPGSPDFPIPGYHDLLEKNFLLLSDRISGSGLSSWKSCRQIISILNQKNPDVVVIPGYDSKVTLASLSWCRKHQRGAILLSESHKIDYKRYFWKEWFKRTIVSKFDTAVVGGSPQVDYVKELGMHSNNIYIGCDVVDNDFWAGWAARVRKPPQFWREKYGLPERFFMTACRLVAKKNVAGLLRAYSYYINSYSDNPWPLVVAGDGPLMSELVELACDLGIEKLVHFVGYKSANDLGPLYGLASVFILASAFSEQWGLVVNEAMAAKKPVLVSRICGCVSDLAIDGITGFTFDPYDFEGISKLLLKISRGDYDLQKMGYEAQIKVKQFSPELFAQHVIDAAELAVMRAKKRRFQTFDWLYLKLIANFI